jgi:hypothetical protein
MKPVIILTLPILLAACGPRIDASNCDDICREGLITLLGSGALTPPPIHPYILPNLPTPTPYPPVGDNILLLP